MKPKDKRDRGLFKTSADAWREFIQAELKQNSKVGKAFEKAGFAGLEHKNMTLYFEDEAAAKTARGQIEPLKKKLPQELRVCNHVDCKVGKVSAVTPATFIQPSRSQKQGKTQVGNPLQSLNFAEFGDDGKGNELSQPVLSAAVQAEKTCGSVYTKLCHRTELLAGGAENTLQVSFSWRLRVGGTRGFRELLLPVFHPVFGVPYIPASSLKGATRAWARQNGKSKSEVSKILGILEGKIAQAAKVEFLDTFPTKDCLSIDVATPQWHWQNGNVAYKPEPHPLLSMKEPQFVIGLCPTKPENAKYVPVVKEWLENALKAGIGSRVSSGYGRALEQAFTLPYHQSYSFELWTQGIYGSEPPSKQNRWQGEIEFRPTAIRGILRYWFRAVALSLYQPSVCQDLEDAIFGKLSQQGKVSISVVHNPSKRDKPPYLYDGRIHLEATEQPYLDLIEKLLVLGSHLGGVGRGSRRPLHLLDVEGRKYMRGCHWTVDADATPLAYDPTTWSQLFEQIKAIFNGIRSPITSRHSSPGSPGKRQQDVLDANAQIWLVRSSGQIAPDKVTNWETDGLKDDVRGNALALFYGDDRFKGERKYKENGVEHRVGNPKVGGALETPSFVWIKSVFPNGGDPCQVVTIFGVDQTDRLAFAKELDKLAQKNPSEAILVFGKMPSEKPIQANRPIRRK
jgi:CRISPR-associated protein Cmr6